MFSLDMTIETLDRFEPEERDEVVHTLFLFGSAVCNEARDFITKSEKARDVVRNSDLVKPELTEAHLELMDLVWKFCQTVVASDVELERTIQAFNAKGKTKQ
jgi:hypothetical protein